VGVSNDMYAARALEARERASLTHIASAVLVHIYWDLARKILSVAAELVVAFRQTRSFGRATSNMDFFGDAAD